MKTGIFRGGCLTGSNNSGTKLQVFLSYLMKCAITGNEYCIFGYIDKQVRIKIHCWNLINMFWHFYQSPKEASFYNEGSGRFSNFSLQESIVKCEKILKKMNIFYTETNRIGDYIWRISDTQKFINDYPGWTWKYNIDDILTQIYSATINNYLIYVINSKNN